MSELTLTYDCRLPSLANLREHWAQRAKRGRLQRALAKQLVAVEAHKCRPPCTVTLIRIAPRRLDDDNLQGAFKYIRDGVADALGCTDAPDDLVTWKYAQEKGKKQKVRIEVRRRSWLDILDAGDVDWLVEWAWDALFQGAIYDAEKRELDNMCTSTWERACAFFERLGWLKNINGRLYRMIRPRKAPNSTDS